ncbi:MAG: biopolymer transporter ExbD [Tenuifilaceae bacterium]|jgi:biopolymer transport protein ExbD|nr:biopolymer transporter ExbD [Bacteroidales bacterium]MDI9515849.1 biopolymer transporter ExbD [Bacteroidota bacterium]NLH56752.1 biopolymer transporter ExbD [Rikenellaceae bacterium]HNV81544.1 biopolymer transporter ExbD [Tenuifilaceae bacterium]MZP82127.1 biopolymer transporter ExbD [Bacteroidales bacterium]
MAKPTPEINGSSMADIAFLLLIFFLVTTTMNVDTGLARMLPPIADSNEKTTQDVKQRNIFTVLINKSDRLLVEGKPMDVSILREKAKEFIANPNNDPDLPEKEVKQIDYFGAYEVPKGVISLQNDRGTSYSMYMHVQNELVAAYNELRNELARSRFGKYYDDLLEDQQKAIQAIYQMRISEAEPKSVGGKK